MKSILDTMNEALLPFLEANTTEFLAFNYAIDYYCQGKKEKLIAQLNQLTASSNRKISLGAKAVLKRAQLETF